MSFSALAAGGRHTCGLTSAGAAYCWGFNSSGRHRARVVEYRVEQHRGVLKEQLAALRVGAGAH